MDVKEGLKLAEQLIDRDLNSLEADIFKESWKGRQGKKYKEIADNYHYTEGHVNDVASDLWKLLSEALGKKVLKKDFRRELEQRWRSHSAEVPQPQESAQEETVSKNPDFVGREEAIAHLNTLIASRNAKVIGIYGKGGVGKTKLAEQYFERYFEANGFKTLRLNVGTETRSITCVEGWLEDCLRLDFREDLGQKFDFTRLLDRLRRQLQAQRVGLLIDNLEPALDENGKFIDPGYVQLLRVLAEPSVKSITLITSRECPNESKVTLEAYPLPELDEDAWREFFRRFEINVNTPVLSAMHKAYGGNALAMKVLSHPIQTSYDGDLEAYWQDHKDFLLKGEINDLVASQLSRLRKQNIKAYKLLCRLGIYNYQNIPKVLIAGVLCLLWDVPEEEHREVVESLQTSHLIEFHGGEYWLHPVIRMKAIALLKSTTELDEIILSIKHQIDCLACDDKLQEIVSWLNQKSLSFKGSYKLAAIRFYYLTQIANLLYCDTIGFIDSQVACLQVERSSSGIYTVRLAPELAFEYTLSHYLHCLRWSVHSTSLDSVSDRIINEINNIQFWDLNINPTQKFCNLLHSLLEEFCKQEEKVEQGLVALSSIAPERKHNFSKNKFIKKRQFLQKLKNQLPNPDNDIKRIKHWWKANGKTWIEQLKLVMWSAPDVSHTFDNILILIHGFNPELEQSLKQLRDKLPSLKPDFEDLLSTDWKQYREWWKVNGISWVEELRGLINLIEKHLNIAPDWQISSQQKEALTQYLNVNRLLVDCLNSASETVRSHIEDTLLLPIAEIEKRRLGD